MSEPDRTRRLALGTGLAGLATLAATPASAQTTPSTWDRIKSSGELRIGVAPGEPYYYKDLAAGTWSGLGPAMAALAAKELNVKVVTVETTWANAVAGLQANQYDVMFVLDATPARAISVDFPVQPLFYYAQGVLVKDGVQAKTWSDLDKPDITIGVAMGTSSERDISARMKQAKIERFPGLDPALLAFQSGRVSALCFFHPALVLMQQKSKLGTVLLPEPYRYTATSAGMRREPDKTWRDWLGGALDFWYNTGVTQATYDAYLTSRGIDPAKSPALIREMWSAKT